MLSLDQALGQARAAAREKLEQHFDAALFAYYGDIRPEYLQFFRRHLETVQSAHGDHKRRLILILNTPGGHVETVEQMVVMIRHFYDEVFFVVPNMAMSAGTIFCMSGDKIYMDYSSALGPIDPQVQSKEGNWVPALGYLDKFEEILQKSRDGILTNVEFAIAQSQDMAVLRRYEQARDLSVSLLKTWLVQYKFRNWDTHRSTGQAVTVTEKEARAQEIAAQLGDNKVWHSHGRMIGIEVLQQKLRLEIDDYSSDVDLRKNINQYHDLVADYVSQKQWPVFVDGKGI
ncbi:ATP-dependent Clp protease proteolytic subunit [Laribacter hongkongensis]|uniref:SDH family Clp fold serine proteinase n=1 Tax=Laribacter hongkongensis TaxID=168471 RepID=UPI001EFE1C69|nr:ATP-dependent Clp protease proteolytic subunit [Laribacter hongkongensis]MCG8993237.1 ATP-dependent Clp protease proteolytic subunit [Laribacter hongkongensis]MCG8997944.1 ATP-dependent Clp protease proteolytic subunit [Laribacter hongkongensis]MCG9002345.1 ATP-dependent Clp protease proteolytic subunit [Laribacter hongkongensis]MCG9005655.1 ATP-dependent Clp protease proteolytic subunit [Laribacter hongkongensis]MCG9008792.1 ATP-dependent Clp protease proteolytic subunit [Laribacter hongko